VAIDIEETFHVRAPIDVVWRFLLDPRQVAPCMPGAELEEIVDDRTFHGNVKIKVGAITTRYKGKVHLTKVDEPGRTIEMSAEGRETSGGTAKGSIVSVMRARADGGTEVVAKATVDLTGRIMQVGRGMIQGVSHQLFQHFVAAVQAQVEPLAAAAAAGVGTSTTGAAALDTPTGTSAAPAGASAPPPVRPEPQAIRVVPLLLKVMWAAFLRIFRRLLGRQPA
jgi:carbon monoxide dehydrogenase subunit G